MAVPVTLELLHCSSSWALRRSIVYVELAFVGCCDDSIAILPYIIFTHAYTTRIVAASPNKVAASVLCIGSLFVTWLKHRLLLPTAIKASFYRQEVFSINSCREFLRLPQKLVSHIPLMLSLAAGATSWPGFSGMEWNAWMAHDRFFTTKDEHL